MNGLRRLSERLITELCVTAWESSPARSTQRVAVHPGCACVLVCRVPIMMVRPIHRTRSTADTDGKVQPQQAPGAWQCTGAPQCSLMHSWAGPGRCLAPLRCAQLDRLLAVHSAQCTQRRSAQSEQKEVGTLWLSRCICMLNWVGTTAFSPWKIQGAWVRTARTCRVCWGYLGE